MIGKKINQLATELAPTTTDLTIIGDPVTGVSKKITLEQLGAIFGGAVSFYTTLGDFPVTGVIDIIYCAKDTQKLYLWSGSAYVEVFPSQSLLDTYQLRSEKGVSNGYASLDSGGKVPISQLPSSIMEYKGTWNAATNTPTLANGTGDTGDVYICNVAGTVNFGAGPITFAVGDYVIYSGSIWQRSSGAVGTVTSVGLSITGDSIGVSNSPITTSGTLALAFAGTSSQYINGAGSLTTFPTLTGYVPYTGATANVDLGTHTLSAYNLIINHTSGSGVAASITKGGNGEALTVVKSSGSGNAASITGGVTLLSELHLTTDLADAYISSASNWNDAYNLRHNAVTIGTANGLSLSTQVLSLALASGSTTGALSSTDWTTFNNKQSALTNPVTGTGTTNFLPKFTGASTIGNSAITDDGTSVTILSRIVGINGASESGWGAKVYENLKVQNNNGTTILQLADIASGGKTWSLISSGTGNVHSVPNGTFYLRNSSDGLTALQVTASGNLGLGVTPSAWSAGGKAIEIGMVGSAHWGLDQTSTYRTTNAYWNSGWKYGGTGQAANYAQEAGSHYWSTAPSGTAGNAISFTQAMTLNASGNLSIGNTNDIFKVDITSSAYRTFRIQASDDVVMTFGSTIASSQYWSMTATANGSGQGSNQFFIGRSTSNPSGLLTKDFTLSSTGAATFSSSVTAASTLYLGNDGTYGSTYRTLGLTGTTNGTHRIFAGTADNLYIAAATSRGIEFWTDGSSGTRMFINTSGNVGIGTTSPNSLASTTNLIVRGVGGSSTALIQSLSADAGCSVALYSGASSSDDPAILFQKNLRFGSVTDVGLGGFTERMRITSGGNVEINTGSIKTGEPDTGWGRAAIKIGASVSGAAFNVTRYLPVNVDGTVYFINLNSSTP